MDNKTISTYFNLFNEISIIEQLARALLETSMPEGILAPHFAVLNHLSRVQDGQTPLTLARAFQVPKTTMTHTLAGLQARELVDLRANPSDGRSKCVWLTDKGRKFRDDAIVQMAPEFEKMAARFPVEQIGQLVPRLADIREYLDRQQD